MLFSESLTVLDMSDDVDQQPDDNGKFQLMKFFILKHRKNCECCPGHYLSTSVY